MKLPLGTGGAYLSSLSLSLSLSLYVYRYIYIYKYGAGFGGSPAEGAPINPMRLLKEDSKKEEVAPKARRATGNMKRGGDARAILRMGIRTALLVGVVYIYI